MTGTSDHASAFGAFIGETPIAVSLKLAYDAEVDVADLTLRPTGPADVLGPTLLLESDGAFTGAVAMDFGLLDGRVVGFEFQMASACLPAELLAQAERTDGANVSRAPRGAHPPESRK